MNLVATCPMSSWREWLEEGDCAGDPATGKEWGFFIGNRLPPIEIGERLYIVSYGRLRGYSLVTRVQEGCICRKGNAIAITIPDMITGFRGYRRVWWNESTEIPFPNWKTEGVK
ncbi:hypothetical protein LCGC14_2261800 [marine sediment metagenome]|uniref:Uncharacterized protein n=1 Tax=marine sediment metagenome TaxID=412755 RepID=A0A0F9CZI2_9ZZZZ